jgi:hypothetical protein
VKFRTRRMRVSGRNNWDMLNFAARDGDLVHLISYRLIGSMTGASTAATA